MFSHSEEQKLMQPQTSGQNVPPCPGPGLCTLLASGETLYSHMSIGVPGLIVLLGSSKKLMNVHDIASEGDTNSHANLTFHTPPELRPLRAESLHSES